MLLFLFTVSNISIGFNVTEVVVSEGEDIHVDVCVMLSGNVDEIEVPFFVEFDLCALGLGKELVS